MAVVDNAWAEQPWLAYNWVAPTGYVATHIEVQIVIPGTGVTHCQVEIVAYNINLLRVLWQIASDGTAAGNYSSSSDASTDKAVANLKNDQVEKYWQAAGCTSEWFQFDAGAGKTIFMDTAAAIAHNLSGSAVVKLYGYGASGDAAPGSWAAVPLYATMTMPDDPDEANLIWIAPTLPTSDFRHWRCTIADPQNADSAIRIGRFVAGSSLVFNGENALDTVKLIEQNFKDEMKLNGFSSISNNRALKRLMGLTFRNLDRVGQSNYKLLKRYIRYCRDTLKALVILDPSTETSKYTYTVFSKLRAMPTEDHTYVDTETTYTSLPLEFDEGR